MGPGALKPPPGEFVGKHTSDKGGGDASCQRQAVAGAYSNLAAAGPTAVASPVVGSIPISATPPTPAPLEVTTWPRALRSARTSSVRVLGTERLPRLARSWPKELMKWVVEKRGALKASSGPMPKST